MKIVILLQSTTGNTRVITRFAAAHLKAFGHEVEVIDIVKHPEPPDLSDVELLGVASPTMYLRPTFTIDKYVTRMPNAPGGRKPAFLLSTCGGMPGAHFEMQAQRLACKDWVVLGAHWMLAPTNWPSHVSTMKKIEWTDPLSFVAPFAPRSWRWVWATLWERNGLPDAGDRDELLDFVDDMVSEAESGQLDEAPAPMELYQPLPGGRLCGRIFPREFPDMLLQPSIEESTCTRCGTCVKVCSEHIISQADDDSVPVIAKGCSGCYACFNRCPEGAIYDTITPPGVGQYKGPPRVMKEMFRYGK